ncbi:hypothetical protein BD779DRAFT_1476377 [Infundibulicybe gibba]|nr:hypothetical protein BD779DRAFT_1476377 [Infundibulicybe gibba]
MRLFTGLVQVVYVCLSGDLVECLDASTSVWRGRVKRLAQGWTAVDSQDILIALRSIALRRAKCILSLIRAILSAAGDRAPTFILTKSAGYNADVLTWKIESEPKVIGGYKKNEEAGPVAFSDRIQFFYPTSILELVFKHLSPAAAGSDAESIEEKLIPDCLNASTTYRAHKAGTIIVVVIRSTKLVE